MEVEVEVTRSERWVTYPLSTGLSQQPDEARLWISRGLCPRTMLLTLRALNVTEKRVSRVVSAVTDTLSAFFRQQVWIPRCEALHQNPKTSKHRNRPTRKTNRGRKEETGETLPPLHTLRACKNCRQTHRGQQCKERGKALLRSATEVAFLIQLGIPPIA